MIRKGPDHVAGQLLVPRKAPGSAGDVGLLGISEVLLVIGGLVQPGRSPRHLVRVVAGPDDHGAVTSNDTAIDITTSRQ